VLAVPALVGSALDPLIGLAGDTAARRRLILAGGIGFAVSGVLTASSVGLWTLLLALLVGNPATGAFVSLAQATLMDHDPRERERNMARWTIAGSVGYVAGPLLLAGAVTLGLGWRRLLLALSLAAVPLARAARPQRLAPVARASPRELVAALRRRAVLRSLLVLQCGDLLLDVFHGFLALYLVDVAGVTATEAAVGVAVWTGAGFVGDVLLLALLRRVGGSAYLRASAAAAAIAYPAFLAAPSYVTKLVVLALLGLLNSGWYALPKAALYAALPGRSGAAVAVSGVGGLVGAALPALLGVVAQSVGLGPTMWALLLAPLALLAAAR
jgi:FSR family fosmidomycin resistance protein-like MFS transporter